MHSRAAMLIEIDKKQEIGLLTSCSKIKDYVKITIWNFFIIFLKGNSKCHSEIFHYKLNKYIFFKPLLALWKKYLSKIKTIILTIQFKKRKKKLRTEQKFVFWQKKVIEGMLGKNANSFVKWCLRSKIECVHLYIFKVTHRIPKNGKT